MSIFSLKQSEIGQNGSSCLPQNKSRDHTHTHTLMNIQPPLPLGDPYLPSVSSH